MLCTLAVPTSGSAKIAGYDLVKDSSKVRENIGLVAEKMIMYDNLTAAENLRFFGKLYAIPKQKREERIDELLELVDMEGMETYPDQQVFNRNETAYQCYQGTLTRA
jgi:ABC-2 type transport system ATP-binding protein